ncbi:MAG: polysaccharide deacetylase family protein [Pseudomonadota bacterium]
MIKRTVKSILQQTAALAGPHRWRSGGQLVILMYHRILPPHDPRYVDEQPGMIVHPDTFDLHLQIAKQHFEIVSLTSWLAAANRNEALPARSLAITFDDGWRDNLQYALPVMRKHQAPGMIFLVSDMVGTTGNYWPEQLAQAIRLCNARPDSLWETEAFRWLKDLDPNVTVASDPEQIDVAIVAAKQNYDDAALRRLSTAMLDVVAKDVDATERALLDWSEILEMQASGLVEFGSHTVDHTRLTQERDEQEIDHQLRASKVALEKGLGKPVDLFCYPNGDHAPKAIALAREHYAAAVTTKRGWNTVNTSRHTMYRIGVHEGNSATPAAFRARLSAWI